MFNKEDPSNFYSYAKGEEDDDTLSFSDLPILGNDDQEINNNSIIKKIPSPSHEDPFEFFNNLLFQESTPTTPRVIISKAKEEAEQEPNVKLSASSSSSSSSNSNHRSSISHYNNNTSSTFSSISNVQKVNITSLTSMSSKSRRIMFMFGPVKFNNEMELSSIKMRQSKSKRALNEKYNSEVAVAASTAGNLEIVNPSATKLKWGLMRSLSRQRSRATVDSTTRSCGCFS